MNIVTKKQTLSRSSNVTDEILQFINRQLDTDAAKFAHGHDGFVHVTVPITFQSYMFAEIKRLYHLGGWDVSMESSVDRSQGSRQVIWLEFR